MVEQGPQFGAQAEEDVAAIDAYYRNHPFDHGKLKQQVEEVISRLTDRERLVMRLRFGLEEGSKRGMTLAEVGKDPRIGKSRWTVGRLERSALAKLRQPATGQ